MNSSNLEAIDNINQIKIRLCLLYSLLSAWDVGNQPIDSADVMYGLSLMVSDISEELDEVSSSLSK